MKKDTKARGEMGREEMGEDRRENKVRKGEERIEKEKRQDEERSEE